MAAAMHAVTVTRHVRRIILMLKGHNAGRSADRARGSIKKINNSTIAFCAHAKLICVKNQYYTTTRIYNAKRRFCVSDGCEIEFCHFIHVHGTYFAQV